MPTAAADSFGVLDRMTAIFEAFGDGDSGLRVSEVAVRADLPKSTVSRLVSSLVRQRYLERDGKLIHLGLRLFELGQLAEEPRELRFTALPVMAELRNRTGETVHLAIRDGHEMVCISIMRGRSAEQVVPRIGGRIPAHATALGRAMLAFCDGADVDAVISSGLAAWTPRTIVEPERLKRELAGIRRTRVAVELGEFTADASSAASPVLSSGAAVAAISVSGRTGEFDPDRSAPAVREAALALTRRLAPGGPAPV